MNMGTTDYHHGLSDSFHQIEPAPQRMRCLAQDMTVRGSRVGDSDGDIRDGGIKPLGAAASGSWKTPDGRAGPSSRHGDDDCPRYGGAP